MKRKSCNIGFVFKVTFCNLDELRKTFHAATESDEGLQTAPSSDAILSWSLHIITFKVIYNK